MTFKFLLALGLFLCIKQVSAKAVFAHFMVANVAQWTIENWKSDIALAQEAHIDAFALNIAYTDPTVATSLSYAFQAANAKSFKLFFSFDYAAGGAWPMGDIINYLTAYAPNGAYFHTDAGQPFVSTFEGPQNASDWTTIKASINPRPFLVPDWSSVGAGAALAYNQADGLFNWNAWPFGDSDSNTYLDAAYKQALGNVSAGGKPYMMPVSPWYFANMPGYDKNWIWRGDDLWYDRWQQVLFVQPEYVEIISWNDFGESHYIGPLDDLQYAAFGPTTGKTPYNYAKQYPHDGWRKTLPFVIDLYKTGSATVTEEVVTAWSRTTLAKSSCSVNGTTGNTASQLQFEYNPADVAQDKIFYTALLSSPPTSVLVNIGGTVITGRIEDAPSGNIGLYHGSVSFSGLQGQVSVTFQRGGVSIAQVTLASIVNTCEQNIQTWNAFVGATTIGQVSTNNKASISGYTCVNGTSVPEFADLCNFTCALGYCPLGSCLCTDLGPAPEKPKSTGVKGYPAAGTNHGYDGLCDFACNLGYCPSKYCGTVKVDVPVSAAVSPFEPLACTSGTGSGDFQALCEYTCRVGYCPLAMCTCLTRGPPNQPYPTNSDKGYYLPDPTSVAYNDICTFVCSRQYCISPCANQKPTTPTTTVCTSGVGDGNFGGLCSFSCGYGFCPQPCTCLTTGAQVDPPPYDSTITGHAKDGLDATLYDPLCNFTCSHGYCPDGACVQVKS